MGVESEYIDAAVDTILKARPDYKREDVEKIVTRMVKERFKDPTIIVDNNVTGANETITLSKLCKWIKKRGPVISGNATFYKQPSEEKSPSSAMLRKLKQGRKEVKKRMFGLDPTSDEYQMLDLDQSNKKVIMNAEYGGSGTPTAAFYTKYSPAATTLMAQSIITTMAALFEGYVGDNQKFFSINEFYDWANKVIQKKNKIPHWVQIPSAHEVSLRLELHFYIANMEDFPYIESFVESCTDEERCYLYYANNIMEFVGRHPKVINLIQNVLMKLPKYQASEDKTVPREFAGQFEDADKYNKWISEKMFLNPYKIPECIKEDMDKIISLFTQFIYVEYITPDSIVKLNNHKRNTVLLVDTDSNIINSDIFVSFILNDIFHGDTFGREKIYCEMILVNVLAASLDRAVAMELDYYGRMHNMDEESRAELTMKNEFMFRRLFLMKTKKRYAASIVLREGNIILPFKPELKGLDFIKAGVTEEVSDKFSKMLEDNILFPEEPKLHELSRDVKLLEKDIYKNLRNGGTIYYKASSLKPIESYKKAKDKYGNIIGTTAWALPPFRGSIIWNEIYPDNQIYTLDRVKIVKLTVTGIQDLDCIKDDYPEIYKTIIDKVFNSDIPEIRKYGLKTICIPAVMKKVPDWMTRLIDYDVTVSDIISSFKSVLESLNMEPMSFKTPNGEANVTSCLISL